MKEGDVLIAPLPQSDGRSKNRPVFVLREMPPYGDFLVCGISSQLHQAVEGFDEIVGREDPDYLQSGLKSASVIRLGFLAVLPQRAFIGKIGVLGNDRHALLLQRLSDYLFVRKIK